ncbi:MAG: 5'-nucleotidase [Gemmatimonadetes bacterium]|nr:MAG: 5'-nucleotidase [Gemmatimonadota bacterium]
MAVDLSNSLVIGISSRALFALENENKIFEEQGLEAYRQYQREHEDQILEPGTAFPLIKALLELNKLDPNRRVVDVIVTSRNSPDLGLRIFNSIEHYQLDIIRAAFTGGASLAPYLAAFNLDLYLSKSEKDVQAAINAGYAAALLYDPPTGYDAYPDQIRIAFDADAVLFSEESERVYQEQGLEAFVAHERERAKQPLPAGPFAKLLKVLSLLQFDLDADHPPVRIAIVTARGSPAHERVIRTLREWDVRVDEAFFLGGLAKDSILKAFRAHIFFDDQDAHLSRTAKVVPSARVPYKQQLPSA